jgi:dUTPase
LSKTNLRLANSTGIIDKGYRGPVLAKVDVHNIFSDVSNNIKKGTRLFQICSPNLEPISKIIITDNLPSSNRGVNGFGSTGK